MQATFLTYIKAKAAPAPKAITKPKSLKVSVDSFLKMFTANQQVLLREKMKYDDFVGEIAKREAKTYEFNAEGLPILSDSDADKKEAKRLIDAYNNTIEAVYLPK